jgi:predicted enzyme related to lactoylglutathione lyase
MAVRGLKSKLIICNVPTANTDAARKFYGALVGVDEFERAPTKEVESYFQQISEEGIDLRITERQHDRDHNWTCFFAVDDVERAVKELSEAGGEVAAEPRELDTERGSAGRFAVVLDPDRNAVGLVEVNPESRPYFRLEEETRSA